MDGRRRKRSAGAELIDLSSTEGPIMVLGQLLETHARSAGAELIDLSSTEGPIMVLGQLLENHARSAGAELIDLSSTEEPIMVLGQLLETHARAPSNGFRTATPTPTGFGQASSSRNIRPRASVPVIDLDPVDFPHDVSHENGRTIYQEATFRNLELFVDLRGPRSSMPEPVVVPTPPPPPPPAPRASPPPPVSPPPPPQPTFSCPICMGQLVEETATRCGHIFCADCIKAAIVLQSRCPTCRKKADQASLIRVYFPAHN